MTTLVKGPIKLVTDRPDTVRKVNLRAPELRLHGAGIVTDHNDDIPVVGGQVEFEALPGPAVLTLVTAGGAPLRSVDIVVPDEETATLAECLDHTYVYEPPAVGRAQYFAREAGEHADRAEAGAARVGSAEQVGAWVEEATTLRGATVEAADLAQTQAGVATEQAGVATEQAGVATEQAGVATEQAGFARAAAGAAAEDARRAETASQGAETIQQVLPDKIGQELETRVPAELDKHLPGELDERVPPLVASSIADDRAVADAAAAAVTPLAQGAVDAAADAIKWARGRTPSGATLDTLADGVWWVQSGWSDLKLPDNSYGTLIKTLSPTPTHGNALFISNTSNRGVWTIARNGTGWQSWTRIDVGGMTTPNAAYVPTSSTLDDLASGTWWVPYGRASGLGLPEALFGSLTISIAGPLPNYRTAFFMSSVTSKGVWTTARDAAGWKNWTRIDLGGMTEPDDGDSTSPVHQAPISADHFPDPTAPLEAGTSRVVMWGDSLTRAGGIRTRLTELQAGVEVINRGISSQTALQIAARQGGRMATVSLAGGAIPASGSVAVTSISELVLNQTSKPANTLFGTIRGIAGTLSNAAGTDDYTFTRNQPGDAVTVPTGTFFVPDHALDSRHDAQIIWAGRNFPGESDPVEAVRAMLKWLTPARKRAVVVSITGDSKWTSGTTNYRAVEQANGELSRMCGTAYIDLRRWLIDHGLDAIGVSPTQEDLDAIAGDAIPRSLSSDGTHFTADAQRAIGTYLHGELLARGWWD